MDSKTLLSLPRDLLLEVINYLPGEDISSLSIQCRELNSIARLPEIWMNCCKKKWNFLPIHVYDGNWKMLYQERMRFPDAVAWDLLEFSNSLSAYAQLSRQPSSCSDSDSEGYAAIEVFEEMMRIVFLLGQMCHLDQGLNKSRMYTHAFGQDCRWWISNYGDFFVAFISSTADRVSNFDAPGGGFVHRQSVPWRRTAINYMCEVASSMNLCSKIKERISAAMHRLDSLIIDVITTSGTFCDGWVLELLVKDGSEWSMIFKPESHLLQPNLHDDIIDYSQRRAKEKSQ